jgi:hypothetical protein
MKYRTGSVANNFSNLIDREDYASLVVRHHHRNDSGVGPQRLPQLIQIEFAFAVDIQPGDFATNLRQMLTQIAHSFVLNAGGNYVTARGILFQKTAYGPVV